VKPCGNTVLYVGASLSQRAVLSDELAARCLDIAHAFSNDDAYITLITLLQDGDDVVEIAWDWRAP
jgi:hypothetical protein